MTSLNRVYCYSLLLARIDPYTRPGQPPATSRWSGSKGQKTRIYWRITRVRTKTHGRPDPRSQILQRQRYHTCYYCKLVAFAYLYQMLPVEVPVVGIFQCRVQGRSRDQEGPNLNRSPVHCEKFKKSKMSN